MPTWNPSFTWVGPHSPILSVKSLDTIKPKVNTFGHKWTHVQTLNLSFTWVSPQPCKDISHYLVFGYYIICNVWMYVWNTYLKDNCRYLHAKTNILGNLWFTWLGWEPRRHLHSPILSAVLKCQHYGGRCWVSCIISPYFYLLWHLGYNPDTVRGHIHPFCWSVVLKCQHYMAADTKTQA